MSSPNHPLTVGSRFGPYRLDRLIGRGGMGEVYQAYDTVKDRTVAIKVLPERLAEDTVYRQRFQRESHAAARLREAHVIPIHDYGEIEGRLFIDMRLVDGDSLRSLLHRHGPGSPEHAVSVVEQVAAALDAAHHDGLLHRDVKPDNILLTHEGFVYLVDFGIAQSATDESLTHAGGAVGSYRYMAPERFSDRDLDPTADVYGLACVLFECLTGTKPFSGGNDAQIMRAHLFDPIPRPSLVRPTVPAAFDAVVARGMAKEPGDRYASAGELAAAARAALGTRTNPQQTAPVPRPSMVTETGPVPTETSESGTRPPDPTGPTGPTTGSAGPTPPRRGRVRRVAAVLGVLVLVAASLAFAGWEYEHRTVAGTAIGDPSTLVGSDVELLSLTTSAGYHRSNCGHAQPDTNTVAFIVCDANPAADAPAARFLRFRTAAGLHDYYNTNFPTLLGAVSCPGDPPGKDAPSLEKGKEVGRRACYLDKSAGPSSPHPGLVLTNEDDLVLAIYIWDVDETAQRDYYAKRDAFQFRAKDAGQDPDFFTDADRYLLKHAGSDYTHGNCRHEDPPVGTANAIVNCSTATDSPGVSFIGFANRSAANVLYQADLGQFPGHSCGGGSGSDDVWRKKNAPAGRYFCFSDTTTDPALPTLVAVHDDLHMITYVSASRPDYPGKSPKTEAELLAWFKENFTS